MELTRPSSMMTINIILQKQQYWAMPSRENTRAQKKIHETSTKGYKIMTGEAGVITSSNFIIKSNSTIRKGAKARTSQKYLMSQ